MSLNRWLSSRERTVQKWNSLGAMGLVLSGLICLWVCGSKVLAAEGTATLSNLAEIAALSPEEAAKGLSYKGKAIVTFSDSVRRVLFLQDGAGGIAVRPSTERLTNETELVAGQLVEIAGVTARGRIHSTLRLQNVRILGESQLPEPMPLGPDDAGKEAADGKYVRMRGFVPALVRYGPRLQVQLLVKPGVAVELIVGEADSPESRELAGSEVEANGVFMLRSDSAGRPMGRICASNPAAVKRIRPVPVMPLLEVAHPTPSKGEAPGPVRMRARVANHNLGEYLQLSDASGPLIVPYRELSYFNPGRQVEVFAWPIQYRPVLVLTNVIVKSIQADVAADEPPSEILTPTSANTNLAVLTSVQEIRKLPAHEASRGYPIRLT